MKKAEIDQYTAEERKKMDNDVSVIGKGKVKDLVLPIAVLIISCITMMLYTGGLFTGKSVITAFSDCEASKRMCIRDRHCDLQSSLKMI